ncbi:HEPN domain-containing protein [Streptomyces sp. NPDC058632]|uniref:HEPN domain-containing protein n=1 Tax=unclassified Streptomyces TaxID=2593676 RepID=UPI0036680CEB
MTYQSPFGDLGTDHEWSDALCLSRDHCTDAPEETIREFFDGAIALIDAGVPQPAFFLARQLAELSLKALLGPEKGHNLGKLLKQLEEADDDLFAAGDDQHLVVEFIRDLHRRDPNGDEGRYPATTKGVPSLATVCCANPPLFREYITILFMYTQGRISRAAQTA